MRQGNGNEGGTEVGKPSASGQNGFISPGKYFIHGLPDFLRTRTLGEVKKAVASKWKIPLRTLTDIEHHSAISLSNWKKLESALGPDAQDLRALCPEGWGHNKGAPVGAGLASQKETDPGRWRFLQWEVDVRIENEFGDAEYQTSLSLENIAKQDLRLSPLHSVWAATDSQVSIRDIRAYDLLGPLEVVENVTNPTFFAFQVMSRQPIAPGDSWRYWWEVSWPRGFPNMGDEDFTYKGETRVDELILKIVLPKAVKPSGQPTLTLIDGSSFPLPWLKLHGRDALVYWRRDVPGYQTMRICFQSRMP